MKFVRAIAGYNHLWAVRDEAKEADELTMLFRKWSNANYLLDFFLANIDDLQGFFHVEKISDAIKDTMEDARVLERMILDKLNACRNYLQHNGIFDKDSFVDFFEEDLL